MDKKSLWVSFKTSPEFKLKLVKAATQERRSVSDYIRLVLEERMEQKRD